MFKGIYSRLDGTFFSSIRISISIIGSFISSYWLICSDYSYLDSKISCSFLTSLISGFFSSDFGSSIFGSTTIRGVLYFALMSSLGLFGSIAFFLGPPPMPMPSFDFAPPMPAGRLKLD
jgi:hypothetical protein